MPDFNPNEMDALFREGAEKHEFEYNPNAWALMEEKLDQKDRYRRIVLILFGLFFLISAVGLFVYLKTNKETHTLGGDNTAQTEVAVLSKSDINNPIVDLEKAETKTAITDNSKVDTKEYLYTDSKESGSNIDAQNSFQSESTGNLIGNEIVGIDSQSETPMTKKERVHMTGAIANTEKSERSTYSAEENREVLSPKSIPAIPFLAQKELPLFNIEIRDINSSGLEFSKAPESLVVQIPSNRFALSVFANPEWSSVGLFQESKAGWSAGARFGYQFSNKFELSVGLAFSRKIYKGAGAEYNMNGGWFEDIEPMRMDAKCDVIEIPLSLAFHPKGSRNTGFFADLGISSYMLHSEWYGFDYNDALVRPDRYVDVVAEDENSHLIGVGRFAIGYQKVLSNYTSLQIAPYLQFPLTGIGAGQVNLYSSGVQLAVKFNTQ